MHLEIWLVLAKGEAAPGPDLAPALTVVFFVTVAALVIGAIARAR